MTQKENADLHHVQVEAVRWILGCKSGLCVVHGEMAWIGEGNGGREEVKVRGGKGRKKSEEEGMREGIESREGRKEKERGRVGRWINRTEKDTHENKKERNAVYFIDR
jgi:hypothetical protein